MPDPTDRRKADAELDRELEQTFPASDPPAVTRFTAGNDVTSAEDVETESAKDVPEEILPKAKDLKW